MGHRLELEDAGHDGMSGEVALKELLVHGEVLDGGALHFGRKAGDAIDEEERISVGKDFEDVLDVENSLGFGEFEGWDHGPHGGIVFAQGFGGFGVGSVAGFDCDDVAIKFAPGEHEVADEVEGFVAGELIVEAHGLFGHDLLATDDDGVFERAAFDEALVEEGLDVFVEGEGAGGGNFFFVELGGHDGGEVLYKAAVFSDVGDGDTELLIGDDGDEGAVAGFEVDGLADFPDFTRDGLLFETGFFNEFDVGARGAIADGGFVGVHFDEGIVDAEADEGGEDMLDGVDADGAFGESSGTFDGLDLGDTGVDEGLVREGDAAEFEAVAFGGGFESEGNFFSSVEGGTFEGGFGCQRVLHVGHERGFRLEESFEKRFYARVSMKIPARTDFEVLSGNDSWLVVGKPAPLIMHPTGKSDEVTLLGALKEAMPEEEFFFVNRLDRETSGCVLVAKSSGVARKLGKMMARREIKKGYEAIVRGWPEWDDLRVEASLRRRGEFEESVVWVRQGVHEAGKASATRFVVRERFERREGRFSLVECYPETGRTHQIRVHLEHVGFPMVGDKIYGGVDGAYVDFLDQGWTQRLEERLILDRQALHAGWMEFEWEGERVRVESPFPEDLVAFSIA